MAITIQDQDPNKQVQPGQTSSRPGPPSANQPGSGYTNLQQIAKANQGNKLGQAVGGGVQQVGQQAQQAIGQSKNDFNQAVQSSNPYLNDTKDTQNKVQNVLKDPTANADAAVGDFAQYRSGQYAGPQSLENYDTLQGQAQSAEQLGQNINSAGGRIALLQRFAANPTQSYNRGQSRLDSALLSMQPQDDLQQAQRATRGLTQQVDTANAAAGATAEDYQARAKALADYTNQQVQGTENPDLETLDQRAKDATAKVNQTLADFQAGRASAEELRAAGLGDLVGQNSLGVDLTGYLSAANPSGADRLGVADSATAAKMRALAKLGGQTDLGKQFTEDDAKKAGYYLNNQFTGADKALAQFNQKKADYNQIQKQQQDVFNNALSPFGDNYDPNAYGGYAGIVYNFLSPDLVRQYITGTDQDRQQIREGQLGDSSLKGITSDPGRIRDTISGHLNDLRNQYLASQNALQRYAGGYTYGAPPATVSNTADTAAAT